MAPRVQLSGDLPARIEAEANQAYPHEACALLLGSRTSVSGDLHVSVFKPAPNLLASTDRFELDPGSVVAATDLAARSNLELLGLWHSHPDRPAVPSRADREGLFPGWICAISRVLSSGTRELRFFREQDGEWVGCPLEISGPGGSAEGGGGAPRRGEGAG